MRFKMWAALVAGAVGSSAANASPFATSVLGYDPGANPDGLQGDGSAGLGEPTRETGSGTATPFNPAFDPSQVVSVGYGGHLAVGFDHRVRDDAGNPFGIDLIIFSNEGFIDQDFPNGNTGDTTPFREFLPESAATIEVSQDGMHWETVGTFIIDLWPTLGTAGTDFTRPVDPSLTIDDADNRDLAGLASLYAGSGGGFGIDLAPTGLAWIQFVRVSNNDDSLFAFEIDAFSDVAVPSPGAALAMAGAGVLAARRRRR